MLTFEDRMDHAKRIMFEAHEGQFRRDGTTPYSEHPLAVAEILETFDAHPEVVMAGLLHDVIEDGPNDRRWMDEIGDYCGDRVLELVMWVTDIKGPGSRAYRKMWTRQKLARAPKDAKLIKLVDRLTNMRDAHGLPTEFRKLYLGETERLLHAIRDGDHEIATEIAQIVHRLKQDLPA